MAFKYQVKRGESIPNIAAKFNLSPQQLLQANPYSTPLSTGQGLRIPQGPGSKGFGGGLRTPQITPVPVTQSPLTTAWNWLNQPVKVTVPPAVSSVGQTVGNALATVASAVWNRGSQFGWGNEPPPPWMTPAPQPKQPQAQPRPLLSEQQDKLDARRETLNTVSAAFPDSTPMESPFDHPKNTIMVDYGEGRTLEQPIMLSPNDLGALAQKAGMDFYDYAAATGYIKVGNEWVFNGSMVNGVLTPNTQPNQSSQSQYEQEGPIKGAGWQTYRNRAGYRMTRNAHGSLITSRHRQRNNEQQQQQAGKTVSTSNQVISNASTG